MPRRRSRPPSAIRPRPSLALQEVEANNAKAQADVGRYKALVDKNEVSRSNTIRWSRTAKALAASVDSARASAESAQKVVEQRRAQLDQARSHAGIGERERAQSSRHFRATCNPSRRTCRR